MNKYLFITALFVFSLSSILVYGQDTQQQDMNAAWQEYMTPGPMHQVLAKGVGEWKAEITMWMDPSQPSQKAEGTSVCEPILDGRYFQIKQTSFLMGMPFSGMEIVGYDNAKKTFFSMWIDNMGTGIMHLEGKYDEATKTITYTGTSTNPMGIDVKVRETIKYIDENNTFFEMFMEQNGSEVKTMEIKFTRNI